MLGWGQVYNAGERITEAVVAGRFVDGKSTGRCSSGLKILLVLSNVYRQLEANDPGCR